MTKIFNNFAENFQKGGIPFLIFFGFVAYVFYRMVSSILPEEESADVKAQNEIQQSVANQTGVKDSITTQDRLIADRLHDACDGWWKQKDVMMEISKSFTSATTTKRIFSAYGIREVSILWFQGEKKNLISAIMDKYIQTSDVGKVYTKIFKNANLM